MSRRKAAECDVRSGKDDRFNELYRLFYRPLREYCRRRLSTDVVDDAVAEVFLTAWRRLDHVPEGDTALLWLYAVAYRVVGHEWRGMARRRRLDLQMRAVIDSPASPADESVLIGDECRRVLDAITRLGPSDAEVLMLVAWEHLSVAEIAVVVGTAPNAVAQRLHRARRNLGREYRRLESRPFTTPISPNGGAR